MTTFRIRLGVSVIVSALTLACALSSPAGAIESSPLMRLQAGVVLDDNLTRAVADRDQRNDAAATFVFSVGERLQLSSADRLSLAFDFEHESYKEFQGLNKTSAGLSASWFRKPGLGPRAPWVSGTVSAAAVKQSERLRDGTRFNLGIQAGKQLNDWLSLSVGYALRGQSASNDVYNGNGAAATYMANISLPANVGFSLGYGMRHGDVTVHHLNYWPPEAPWMWVYTFGAKMSAYRIRAVTKTVSATFFRPLRDNSSVYLGGERQETRWGTLRYPNNVYRAGVTWAFK